MEIFGFRLKTRYCPNSGPERVALHMGSYARYTSLASRESGTEKSIPKKNVQENLSNNMYGCPVGTISTKCCDFLNIPCLEGGIGRLIKNNINNKNYRVPLN
ncbi:hypothetical protein H8356DRAFT_1328040 [Neocallimastix lanati (nom. inval.)]|nr:hypothetical protein H8356DRAFT_1328040 [Neocallimastix sp. JGI-2020a]